MIRADRHTKRHGDRTVVRDLSFTVRPGTVTGFLGPDGAGTSTTLRLVLGLDGRASAAHRAPLTRVDAPSTGASLLALALWAGAALTAPALLLRRRDVRGRRRG